MYRFSYLLVVALGMIAQTSGVYSRLQEALQASGQSQAAVQALQAGKFLEVERILTESANQNQKTRPEVLALEAVVAFLSGDMHASVMRFTDAARVRPLNDDDSFTFAMALVRLGDDDRARSLISGLFEKHPDRALYLYWLGRLDYDQRLYEQAIEKLRRAAELDPGSYRIWEGLGLAFDMQGKNEEAFKYLEKAAALNRTQTHPSPWPSHDLGFLLLRMNKPQEAETALREALRYNPSFAQAHYHLGRALEEERRDAEAIQEYVAAVSEDKTSPEPCYSLARLYRKLGREQDAEGMFTEYKSRKQAQAEPDVNIGSLH